MKVEIQNELVEIYSDHGALNPEAVVAHARNEDSALHSQFEWDDTRAAHQHRLEKARKLIRVAVTVIPAISNSPVKQFISISALRGTDDGSYIATVDILSDEHKYAMVMQDVIRSLERLKYQYAYIRELNPVWTAIDKAVAKVKLPKAA
jgi:hypothetical protein